MGQGPIATAINGLNPDGVAIPIKVDADGNLIVVAEASGEAVSIADGADVAQGAVADAAYSGTGSATIIALLKALAGRVGPVPAGATPVVGDSGNVANAIATATLAGASSKTTYISGLVVTAAGATAAAVVTGTITGLLSGTGHFTFTAPAGATLAATPLVISFPQPIPANAANTAIAVTLPALGSGNTNATVQAFGFQK